MLKGTFNIIFNPVILTSTRNDREISDSRTLLKVLEQSGIGTTLAYDAKFINKKIMGITRNAEKVNSKSGLLVKSDEILKYDYREGKVKHYYEIVYNENGIIVIKSIDSDDILAISIKKSGLKQDVARLNELLSIQERKLIGSDVNDKRVYKIYKINFPNGKVYMGQTIQKIGVRFKQELTSAFTRESKEYDYPLSRALRKYLGEDLSVDQAFEKSKEFRIFPELWHVSADQQDANNAEKFWIGYYHSQFDAFGYNILEGGLGVAREKRIINLDILERAFKNALFISCKAILKENVINYLNKLPDAIKERFKLIYEVTDHILSNSIRYHYGESTTFEMKRKELIYEKISPFLKQGYNPYEIKNKLKLVENVETIKSWIENNILETDLNSIDIVLPNLIRENILNGRPDYSKMLTRLPGVPNSNRENWVLTKIEKLSDEQFNKYVRQVLIGLIKEKITLNENELKSEILNLARNMNQGLVSEEKIKIIINQLNIHTIKTKYLGDVL